jgi:stage V sporulation protein SpoVS
MRSLENNRPLSMLLVLLLCSVTDKSAAQAQAQAAKKPNCLEVQAIVNSIGSDAAKALAIANGISERQIELVRRVCRIKFVAAPR